MSPDEDLTMFSFPEKLWHLVNQTGCKEIHWGPDGESIVIPDNQAFASKVLNNSSKVVFKTKNFSSFVRQLNLYGFRKVSEHKRVGSTQPTAVNRSEFKHQFFRKNSKDLLESVKRQHTVNRKEAESPLEEKPNPSLSNNQSNPPPYHPMYSAPPPYGVWPSWDPYMQTMGLFPPGAFGMPSPSAFQAPGYYSRSPNNSMGLPYGSYLPQYYQVPQYAYDGIDTMDANRTDPNAEIQDIDTTSVPAAQAPSKSSVVIINNPLSTSGVTENSGCYSNREVSGQCYQVDAFRSQEEAKKPIPVQTAASTPPNTAAAPRDCCEPTKRSSEQSTASLNKTGLKEMKDEKEPAELGTASGTQVLLQGRKKMKVSQE